jgi:TatA/E family protein of Tat protein translocase
MPTPGPLELVIILVIALLILGPGKLPDVGAALGKSIREFRKASTDVQDAVKIDTSPLPATPPAATTATTAAAAAPVDAAPAAAPVPEPAVAATAADLPGAPTVPSAPTAPSSEPTPGTN